MWLHLQTNDNVAFWCDCSATKRKKKQKKNCEQDKIERKEYVIMEEMHVDYKLNIHSNAYFVPEKENELTCPMKERIFRNVVALGPFAMFLLL